MEGSTSRYPEVGEVIDGKYRIDRMLGEGGMGAVAGAYHLLRKAPVALKFISPDMQRVPGAIDRFINEAVAASAIESEHVVQIYDVGRLPTGLPYIVMEMMQGCDLSDLLQNEGGGRGLPIPRAVHFILQILRGLHVAHARGIVHRDLKPSNAFVVTKEGEPDFVKLLDFGISKVTQDEGETKAHLTQTNTALGTPLYMSPEQARNAREATARSDIYSVGAMLYELLTGRTPYLAESPNDLLFKLFTAQPDPIKSVDPNIPDELARIIHASLDKEPDKRPPSALAFAEMLSPFADDRSHAVLAKLRGPGSMVARASALPPTTGIGNRPVTGLDATIAAPTTDAGSVAAQTAVSRPGGNTQLDMGVSGAPPAPSGSNKTAMLAVAGLALAAVLVGVGFAVKGGGETNTSHNASTAATTTVTAEPSATQPVASSPTVVPVVASVEPPAPSASATAAKSAPPAVPAGGPGPAKKGPSGKANPFNVGIVQ